MQNFQYINNFQGQNQNAQNNNELYPGDHGFVPDEHDSNQAHVIHMMEEYEDGLPKAGEEHPMAPDPGDYESDPNDDNGYVEEGGEVEVIGNDTSVCNDFFAEGV
jgi:hypothetical protein